MGERPASVVQRWVLRLRSGGAVDERDLVAQEEPLEIRVAGEPVAVTMRTPGEDARLALGFLFTEGVLRTADDVGTIAPCGRPGEDGFGNIIEVTPASGACLDLERLQATRRGPVVTAACGICGRRTVEDLLSLAGHLPDGPPLPLPALGEGMRRLEARQPTFRASGGTHAAGAIDAAGELLAAFEDVGRHNAVDKVIGALVQERRVTAPPRRGGPLAPPPTLAPAALLVTGRASSEIIHKAAMARIPVVASVSATTSLAVDLAARLGMAVVTFLRGTEVSVFGNPARLTPAGGPTPLPRP